MLMHGLQRRNERVFWCKYVPSIAWDILVLETCSLFISNLVLTECPYFSSNSKMKRAEQAPVRQAVAATGQVPSEQGFDE